MDENLESGFCIYCGSKIVNDNVSKVKVSLDRSSDIINTLRLAKYYIHDKDLGLARRLIDKVMEMDTENSDVWYMDAVIDYKNRKTNLSRASGLKSFGVFTLEDYHMYKDYGKIETMPTVIIVEFTVLFMAIFMSIPIMIVFEMYWLTPMLIILTFVIIMSSFVFFNRKSKNNPQDPLEKETLDSITKSREEQK